MKRKIEVVPLPPKNVNTVIKPKALLKADLIVKMNELQGKYDTLKKENAENKKSLADYEEINSKNHEMIKELKAKLEHMEREKETG